MADGVEVSAVREEEFEAFLPMIGAYQRFYEVHDIDNERNRFFFRRFLAPSADGELLAARDESGLILGYACLYWHFSSLAAVETVLMNDLFVAPEARGRGVGRALIEASAAVARGRPRSRRRLARVGDRPGQPHRPAPLRLDDQREIDLARVRARRLGARLPALQAGLEVAAQVPAGGE